MKTRALYQGQGTSYLTKAEEFLHGIPRRKTIPKVIKLSLVRMEQI